MADQTKITTAVLAGYLLGRTKQGKRALRLALWLNGGGGGAAAALAQQAKTGLVANPAVAELLEQVRGPLLDAGRKALTAAVENRANSLADALQSRTEALSLPGGVVESVAGSPDDDSEPDEDSVDEEAADEDSTDEDEQPKRGRRQPKADAKPRRTTKAADDKAADDEPARVKREPAKRTRQSSTTRQSGTARQSGGRQSGTTRSGTTRRRGTSR